MTAVQGVGSRSISRREPGGGEIGDSVVADVVQHRDRWIGENLATLAAGAFVVVLFVGRATGGRLRAIIGCESLVILV